MGLIQSFHNYKMKDLVEETAKFHLPFGILLVGGVLYTKIGLVEFMKLN